MAVPHDEKGSSSAPLPTVGTPPYVETVASHFHRLLGVPTLGVVLARLDGTILDATDAFLQLLGSSREELEAGVLSWRASTPPEYAPMDEQACAELRTTGVTHSRDKEYCRKDGSRVPVTVGGAMLEGSAELCIGYVLERRGTAHEGGTIGGTRTFDAMVSQQVPFLFGTEPPFEAPLALQAMLQRLARLVVPELADWCEIDLAGPDGSLALVAVAHASPVKEAEGRRLRERYPLDRRHPSLIIEVLQTGQPRVLPVITDAQLRDTARDSAHFEALSGLGLRSAIVVPLLGRDRTLGTLSLATVESDRQLGAADLALAETVARNAAAVVEQARLLEEARAARTAAERLQAVTMALSGARTPEQVARAIVDEGLASFGVDAGSVWLLDDEGGMFTLLGYKGYAPEDTTRHMRVPVARSGPLGEAVSTGGLVAVESPEELIRRWPHLAPDQAASGDAATLAVPLSLEGQILGVLYLAFRTPRRFSTADRDFLTTLGRQCAQALERARLYEAERRTLERQGFLAEASKVLAGSLDPAAILRAMAALAVPRMATWCVVFQRTDAGDLRLAALAHADPEGEALLQQAANYPMTAQTSTPLTRVMHTGRAEIVTGGPPAVENGRPVDPDYLRIVDALRPTSIVSVPLLGSGRVLGAMVFNRWSPGTPYTDEDLALFEELGRRAGQALENARLYEEAQEAIRIRDQFLIIASHELKTPLTSLLGAAQLVHRRATREGTLTERDRRGLEVVVAQAQRQRRLVEALLDLSRLEAGQFRIERAPVDLVELVGRVVEDARLALDTARIAYQGATAPVVVIGDELRLEQALQSLVQNAVKYSPADTPVVLGVEQQNDQAIVTVRDRGVGIPADAIPSIFKRFYRAPSATPLSGSGLGIGLHVVKEIVLLHGGEVLVESTVGEGSSFRVCLPLATGASGSSGWQEDDRGIDATRRGA